MDNQDKKQEPESKPKRAVSKVPRDLGYLALDAFMDALDGSPEAAVRSDSAERSDAALDIAKNFMARLGPHLGQAVKDGDIQEHQAIGYARQWVAYIFDSNPDTYPPNFSARDLEREDPEAWMFLGISPDGQHPYELLPNKIDERIRFVAEVSKTAEWLAFERAISDAEAKAQGKEQPQVVASQTPPLTWQDIEIVFLSEHSVQVFLSGKPGQAYNYAEFGFEDRRSGKPIAAWDILFKMTQSGGAIPRPLPGKDKSKRQKRIEEIREKLKAHFKIETDPIPFNGNTYQASFKIRRGLSFDS